MSTTKPTKKLSYAQMNDQLDIILAKFDDPTIDIERSIELYKTAVELIRQMESYLSTAKNTIEQIDKKPK